MTTSGHSHRNGTWLWANLPVWGTDCLGSALLRSLGARGGLFSGPAEGVTVRCSSAAPSRTLVGSTHALDPFCNSCGHFRTCSLRCNQRHTRPCGNDVGSGGSRREQTLCRGSHPLARFCAGLRQSRVWPMQWRYHQPRSGSNRPEAITPWTWLVATLAGVLIAAGLVIGLPKVIAAQPRLSCASDSV